MAMKIKFYLFIIVFLVLYCSCNRNIDDSVKCMDVIDYLEQQYCVDRNIISESEKGYSFDNPLVVLNPYGNAPLSAVAIFDTEDYTGGTVCVCGDSQEDNIYTSFESAKRHIIPIVGLYPARVNKVTITLDNGITNDIFVETEVLSTGLTNYSFEMIIPEEYDFSKLTFCSNMILHCYVAYDSKGCVRWILRDSGANAFTVLDNGHFIVPNKYSNGSEFPNGLTGIREMDAVGKVYNTYICDGGQHHEIIVMDNGNYMFTGSRPGFKTNRDYVFEIDSNTGEVVREIDMAALIKPGSSGCVSDTGADWCHANALAYDKKSDTLLVSCRHLSAVIALDYSQCKVKWILGDPAGWKDEYRDYLLVPKGEDLDWAYGQHEISFLNNGDILMFDNGSFSRVKKVNSDKSVPADNNYSRAIIYRVNEDSKTVSKVWEYGRELGSLYHADSMSGIQALGDSKYLVCFGTCNDGKKTVTHVQLIKDNSLIWQLNYEGSSTYRSCNIGINEIVNYDVYANGKWHGNFGETEQLGDISFSLDYVHEADSNFCVELFPFNALRFSGSVKNNINSPMYALLVSKTGVQYVFDLGYTKQKAHDETIITLNRWVSLIGLDGGEYKIFIVMNNVVYDTGKCVSV